MRIIDNASCAQIKTCKPIGNLERHIVHIQFDTEEACKIKLKHLCNPGGPHQIRILFIHIFADFPMKRAEDYIVEQIPFLQDVIEDINPLLAKIAAVFDLNDVLKIPMRL